MAYQYENKSLSMKILVTGANGFLGRNLCSKLQRQDHVVIQVEVGSIDKNTDWSVALHKVDIVIHLAARVHVMDETSTDPQLEFCKVNVDGTLHLAQQAVNAGVKRFIFISSIGVNGNVTAKDRPFNSVSGANPHDPYSFSKLEAEKALQKLAMETRLEVVIIRPPLVYGSGAPGNFQRIINSLKKQLPLPLGNIHNKRSFVYVGNLVSLILRCIDHPAASNQVFLVSDGHDISTTDLLRGCASALGVKAILLPIPQKVVEICMAMVGKQDLAQKLCSNLQVDISKTCTLLDWEPPISVADGLKATTLDMAEID